jgi:hypothetical protein
VRADGNKCTFDRGASTKIRTADHLGLAAELVREALLTYVKGFDRVIIKRAPITFLAGGPSDELLSLSTGGARPSWLSCHTLFEMSPRRFGFSPEHQVLAIATGVRTRRVISADCKTLVAAGVSPSVTCDARGLVTVTGCQEQFLALLTCGSRHCRLRDSRTALRRHSTW